MSDDPLVPGLTALRARGYAVLPAPRTVELTSQTVRLDANWRVQTRGIAEDDIACRTLAESLRDEHGVSPTGGSTGSSVLCLSLQPGAVRTGAADQRDEQAYRLRVAPAAVELIGNAPAGLFHGVQTLLQLLDGSGRGPLTLPVGTITDWPTYPLRFVHWDTKHHQDRVETLRRFLDWMARFKLNAVSFELEDKFAYPSHPVIGAPGAFTTEQMQELVRYGLERHIQIVPNVQAPAHMCYVLKHDEFAHLRCDGSNYQICMDDPRARRLIFDMYDDLVRATEGVKYFHVSTDEVYYAGICEKYRKPYQPQNRSRTWVDFVHAAHEHLARRGRRILIWAEYPLLAEHVRLLPPDVIDGILSPRKDEAFVRATDEQGIRQLAYSPIQGEEKLFPNHFAYTDRDGRRRRGRLADAFDATLRRGATCGNPIGTFAAAWDDSGLHNETFWLGWATMAQGGWTPGAATVEETVSTFMDIHHGRGAADMVEVYRDLQDQARFWEHAWDRAASRVRGPAYGNHAEKRPIPRTDLTLEPPALPALPDLAVRPVYRTRYADLLAEAPQRLRDNDRLLGRLYANLGRAERNRYSLEVFLSLARFVRRFIETLLSIDQAEQRLRRAHETDKAGRRDEALAALREALALADRALGGTDAAYRDLVRVWEKSRYPRNAAVAGKSFVHVMDDVKDHFADRRPDLRYHLAPFESIGLDQWRDALAERVGAYVRLHDLA